MRDALTNGEYAIYLQPQFSLEDGSLVGAELLCRWDSPELGFLAPDRFIPQFERNGFISELDFYMMEQACSLYPLVDHPKSDGTPVHLAVNFSRVTMLQNDFVERFDSVVRRFDIPASFLHVEITESAFSADEKVIIDIIADLQERGFPIAMDDFGTGYSSLSLLKSMPIDVLKIDRGFLSASEDDARSRRVLEYVIALANAPRHRHGVRGNRDGRAGRSAAQPRMRHRTGLLLRPPDAPRRLPRALHLRPISSPIAQRRSAARLHSTALSPCPSGALERRRTRVAYALEIGRMPGRNATQKARRSVSPANDRRRRGARRAPSRRQLC